LRHQGSQKRNVVAASNKASAITSVQPNPSTRVKSDIMVVEIEAWGVVPRKK
jgi:hypothetical protein